MQGLDNFKTATKETGGSRNVVPRKNAAALALKDYKEIKQNSFTRSWHNKNTLKIEYMNAKQPFFAMLWEERNWNDQRKAAQKDDDRLIKWLNIEKVTDALKLSGKK